MPIRPSDHKDYSKHLKLAQRANRLIADPQRSASYSLNQGNVSPDLNARPPFSYFGTQKHWQSGSDPHGSPFFFLHFCFFGHFFPYFPPHGCSVGVGVSVSVVDLGGGIPVPRQSPLHTCVMEQIAPVGQGSPFRMHGCVGSGGVLAGGGGGAVAMQAPPHGRPPGGQTMVGVQVAPVGQGALLPTVQGTSGGMLDVIRQSPPQVEVWVQIEPVGQGEPPMLQLERGGKERVAVVAARVEEEKRMKWRSCMFRFFGFSFLNGRENNVNAEG